MSKENGGEKHTQSCVNLIGQRVLPLRHPVVLTFVAGDRGPASVSPAEYKTNLHKTWYAILDLENKYCVPGITH